MRFVRQVQQGHAHVLQPPASLTVIASRAGGDHVVPNVFTAQMARQDVVNREV